LVTAAIWKALVARDQHCRFPNCSRPPLMCHAHHLEHWLDHGPTSLDNMILLCSHHHRLIHAAPWTIRRTGPADFDFDPPPGIRQPDHRQPVRCASPEPGRTVSGHRPASTPAGRVTPSESRVLPNDNGTDVHPGRWNN
ncbi:MAG: HNH endonuclease signature motif containing protein, partial [Marmoricola sp.]